MQANLHPDGYGPCAVSCSGCGHKFEISSLRDKSLVIEMCYRCHPAYTGKRKVSTAGAIEKFAKKYGNIYGASAGAQSGENAES